MGDNESYTGTGDIKYSFMENGDSPGASLVICATLGERTGSEVSLMSVAVEEDLGAEPPVEAQPSTEVLTLKSRFVGLSSNNLTYSLTDGTYDNKLFIVKYNEEIVIRYDNIPLQNIPLKLSRENPWIEATIPEGVDLSTVSVDDIFDEPFTGGTEPTTLTNQDLSNALLSLKTEVFDKLLISEGNVDLEIIKEYLISKFAIDKGSAMINTLDYNLTVDEKISDSTYTQNKLITNLSQVFEIDNKVLTPAETSARYASFMSSFSVQDSTTHKIIPGLTRVIPEYSEDEQKLLTQKGITVFKKYDNQTNTWGVVTAVTLPQEYTEDGELVDYHHQHVLNTELYLQKYLDIEEYLGNTGYSRTLTAIKGHIDGLVKNLLNAGIVTSLTASVYRDPREPSHVITDFKAEALGIVMVITKRYNVAMET